MQKINFSLNNAGYKQFYLLLLMLIFCGGCWQRDQNLAYVNTTNIVELENVRVSYGFRSTSRPTSYLGRARVLKEFAMGLGAQAGLAWASERMNSKMTDDRKYLDTIFNFNGMMLTHGVIPPVLVEGDFSLNLDDPTTIRVADRTYKIVKQARFATTAPNWREYLWLDYPAPKMPERAFLPHNQAEQVYWREGIRIGWERGIQQGYTIFQENLARLKRDFRGMILYRKLLQERMISPPFVSRTELGVTGDGNDMRVNDQVLRIVELPQLQTSAKNWKAIVVKQ